jgi:hypothetical protein
MTMPIGRCRDRSRASHSQESGFVIVLVMTILAALLVAGAIALSLQLGATRQAGLVKSSRSALYCAEAGLQFARDVLIDNRASWSLILDADASNDPVWYPITGEIDEPADGALDYQVTVRDDGDDTNLAADSNDTIIVVSRCTKYADAPAEVMEVISMTGSSHAYRAQAGQGPGNTGNAN